DHVGEAHEHGGGRPPDSGAGRPDRLAWSDGSPERDAGEKSAGHRSRVRLARAKAMRTSFAPLLAPSLAIAMPALAQTADSDRALALGHEGLDLYNKGDWQSCQARFIEADRLAHSPVFVLYLARCARNAGDLRVAMTAYDRLVVEVVPAGSPAPWA